MADTTIKPEIKIDPAAPTTDMSSLPAYTPETSLAIPLPPTRDGPQAWLVKVPHYIWTAWSEIYRDAPSDDQRVEIGKMRVYNPKPGEDASKPSTEIILAPGVPQHLDLPKTFELDIQTTGYSNHCVFGEKDLPGHGHAAGSYARYANRARTNQLKKPQGIPLKSERYGNNDTKKPGAYRTSIPKQTSLAPLIMHVADAAPKQDSSYLDFLARDYAHAIKPKHQTIFENSIDRRLPTQTANASSLSSFGLTSRPGATTSRRNKPPPKEKAVRMEPIQLMDALQNCFKRYKYWSLRALRNELRQPEAFIKSTLEEIATLVRSGDFAMNYMLRPEYEGMLQGVDVKEETAVVKSEDEGDGGVEESEADMDGMEGLDDDDGEMDFEDVGE